MFGKFIKLFIGIIAIPIAVGISVAFIYQINNITDFNSTGQRVFFLGIVLYVIVHLFLFKPTYLYVFGHELVHAISIWLCLGKVKKFKVTKKGGSVTGTKNNLFISTSPYFIPVIPIILAIIYFVLISSFNLDGILTIFMGLLGFTFAMHLVMTIDTLKVEQPDLVSMGQVLATVLVVTVNVAITGFLISLLFNGFNFQDFMVDSYTRTKDIYVLVVNQFLSLS